MVLKLLFQKSRLVPFHKGKLLYLKLSASFSHVNMLDGTSVVDRILVCLQGSCLVTGPSLLKAVPVGLVYLVVLLLLKFGKYRILL